jgi:RNA polymerase subunit RPABC4/transcription elongation factor Spt4
VFGQRRRDRPNPGDPIGGWCESCGTAYAVGAGHCPECGRDVAFSAGAATGVAPLVDSLDVDGEPAVVEDAGSTRHDTVEYDLADWDEVRRVELTRQLDLSRLTHLWRGSVLVVPGAHEAEVDELVDAIDGLDEDAPAIEYELPAWTIEQCDELVRRLQAADLAFDWDGCVLAVDPSLEHTVDGIVRSIDPAFPL